MRIADAAYAAEDVIESHIVDTIQLLSSSGPNQSKLTRLFNLIHSAKKEDEQIKSINFKTNLHKAIEGLKSINKIAMNIDKSKKVVVPAAASISSSSSTFSNGPSSTTIMVSGFEEASLSIMEKLTEDRPDRQIIPIVGMGGIGKTTLARHVYEKKLTKDRFHICAWATISQQYNTREIICDIFSQVSENDKKHLSGISEDELGLKLRKYLFGRRFLIVMDDMWNIDAWENIQGFFPNNQNGSRILVTTRLLELSSKLNNYYSHQVGFLDEASSWDLFSNIVFGEKNICPNELKKIGKKIVDGCRGLPLSIVVVGGLLRKMDATQPCWESIGSNLTSVVNLDKNKHCLRLLRLSYNHLPVYLKPCFLYVGVFEEDAEIRVSTLVKLWISEGFLKPANGESLETCGMGILRELVDRNLVLVCKLGFTGNIRSCKIHDLLRDLCLKEGQNDGFYHVIGQRSPGCTNSQRRVVIPSNAASKRDVCGDLRSMPHAHSVICEDGIKVPKRCNLGLLRTFHTSTLDGWGVESYTRSFALQYVNLRYLTIKGGIMTTSFLSSISLVWNLHKLIGSHSSSSTSTISEFWKMPQLRHIKFGGYIFRLPDPPSVDNNDAIIMENLQVLKGVVDFKFCREVVKKIPNIKKLKLRFTNVDEYCFISNIKFLSKLESLSVDYTPKCFVRPFLNSLTFPRSLKRLYFGFNACFEWDESRLENLGSLPFLKKLSLSLQFWETWEIVEGQFPNLKYLGLIRYPGLKHWTTAVEGSSIFPCLEEILLFFVPDLKSIPCEIGDIPTLQKISIHCCNEAGVKFTKEMVEEQMELQGDQLPFRVLVFPSFNMNKELMESFSGPNFEVRS